MIDSEEEVFRLKLVQAFQTTLKNSLYLLGIEVMEEQIKLAKKAAERGMSVREVEKQVEKKKQQSGTSGRSKTLQFSKIPKISDQLSQYLESPVKINMGKKKGKIDMLLHNGLLSSVNPKSRELSSNHRQENSWRSQLDIPHLRTIPTRGSIHDM